MNQPLVSVVMPVYNSVRYLQEAIDSILTQSYTHFEFLIYDDASTDGTRELLLSYSDPRIRLKLYSKNAGYLRALNEGLSTAKGVYIARMDADDVSMNNRFEKQVEFLENFPEYGLVGSWYKSIPGDEIVSYPVEDEDICVSMLRASSFAHPSVLFRTELVRQNNLFYRPEYVPAEDYLFFYQFSKLCKLKNLPLALIQYRRHDEQTGFTRKAEQRQQVERIQRHIIADQGLLSGEEQLDVYSSFLTREYDNAPQYASVMQGIFDRILDANSKSYCYDQSKLSLFLSHNWNEQFINAPHFSMMTLRKYCAIRLPHKLHLTSKQMFRFLIKCLMHYKKSTAR